MADLKYLIVGGDNRFAYLGASLIETNKEVDIIFSEGFEKIIGEDKIGSNWQQNIVNSDVIIFPLPISRDNQNLNSNLEEKIALKTIIDMISSSQIVIGGAITNEVKKLFSDHNINIIDYLDREELAVLNAVPTAEGALEIAMRELPITIYNSKCLVTGFGRISKVLIRILNGLGAKTTVIARKHEDLSWATIYGCNVAYIKDLSLEVKDKDIIFNTVPNKIIDSHILSQLRKDCLIIDLASDPGGVDFDKAKDLNLKAIWALALPGKVAPKTAGEMIHKTIDNILNEINFNNKN